MESQPDDTTDAWDFTDHVDNFFPRPDPLADFSTESAFLRPLHEGLSRLGVFKQSLLIAVSGGADSVALLVGCCRLAESLRLEIHAAHFNHRLRGDESDADAEWVQSLCDNLGVPLVSGKSEAGHSLENRGIEAAARDERYQFLESTAYTVRCHWILTAHTANDQAETVLHHIIRGTGLAGLRGIPERRLLRPLVVPKKRTGRKKRKRVPKQILRPQAILRPMLAIRRAEVEAFLARIGQDFRTDSTNDDSRFTRNRLRHELIPLLESDFHPAVVQSLLRLSRQAADAEETIRKMADRIAFDCVANELFDDECEGLVLDAERLIGLPRHLCREVFVRLWDERKWPRGAMTFAHWERLATLVNGFENESQPASITLPGNIRCRRKIKNRRLVFLRPIDFGHEFPRAADDVGTDDNESPAATTDLAGSCDDPLQGNPPQSGTAEVPF